MIFPNPHRISGTSAWSDCKWCQGNGCLQCETERDKAYKAQFPNGPQPIAVIPHDGTPEGIAAVFKALMGGIEEAAEKRAEAEMPRAFGIASQLGYSFDDTKKGLTHAFISQELEDRARAMDQSSAA